MAICDDEPKPVEWVEVTVEDLLDRLREHRNADGLTIVGIDGRSGSGKSTIAARLAAADSSIAIVHTDDIAWHHSFFSWHKILAEEILRPLRTGGPPVSFRPPAWSERGRPGAIDIPSTAAIVLVEGVGATHREVAHWLDAAIWVHTDPALAQRRCVDRRIDPVDFIEDWMAQENPFLADDRPWSRASVIISGERVPAGTSNPHVSGKACPGTLSHSHGQCPVGQLSDSV
ncbi:uridine kinase family protein [Rhodococcus sp. T7]|uniref:uridine kinase family protein n=1 Tax=Rhodococcus sp. T7 TaxID=627444 RepID=UPI0013C8D52E|nr:hypothetical protein [Rhodococcus sp. T7]KAF0962377.1 hypothetical protein MLGJGCBP_04514 [Rhodococcus sp. T7]